MRLRIAPLAGVVTLVLLVVPVGTFDPTPRYVEPRSFGMGACDVLNADRIVKATDAMEVETLERTIPQEDDPLGTSHSYVARSSCTYTLVPPCVTTDGGFAIEKLTFDVIVMLDVDAAGSRYEAARIINTNTSRLHERTFRDHITPMRGFSVASSPQSAFLVVHADNDLGAVAVVLCNGEDPVESAKALYDWGVALLPTDLSLR